MKRRIGLLFGAGGIGHVITAGLTPVLAWLYEPAAFGALAGVMSVVSISMVVVHGRYHLAVMIARNEREAVALVWAAAILSAILSPLVAMLVGSILGDPIGMPIWAFVAITGLLTFVSALIDILAYWRSYKGRLGVTARNTITRSIITSGSQLAMSPMSSSGLIAGTVLGAVATASLGLRDVLRNDGLAVWRTSRRRMLIGIRKFSHYPLFGVPQGAVAALAWNALPLLILRLIGADAAGQYWLAYRLLVAPTALFNGAYRQAVLPILGKSSDAQATVVTRRHSAVLLLLAGLAGSAVFLLAPAALPMVLSEQWSAAGAIMSWLAVAIVTDIAKIPASCLLQIRGAQAMILRWELGIALVRYGMTVPILIQGELISAIAVYAMSGFLGWIVFIARVVFAASAQSDP